MIDFSDLGERELMALAISLEEEDGRIYDEFAEGLRESYPDTARMFRAMADEETGHRHRLLDLYRAKFGDRIPLIRRQDVRGFVERKPVWLSRPLGLDKVRAQAELLEAETKRFYARAARRSERQFHLEARAAFGRIAHQDAAAVQFDELFGNRQS